MPQPNVIQDEFDRMQAEINRLTKANSDLLADSKRHEALAKERGEVIELFEECTDDVACRKELVRLRQENQDLKRHVKNANKYVRLLGTHLLNKRLGKLGLHQNNQKGFQQYKDLVDKFMLKGWLYPPRAGPYSQRIVREKHIYNFEEYMKSNWRETYTKCIDHYSRKQVRWRE
jgi:hypothetical protein